MQTLKQDVVQAHKENSQLKSENQEAETKLQTLSEGVHRLKKSIWLGRCFMSVMCFIFYFGSVFFISYLTLTLCFCKYCIVPQVQAGIWEQGGRSGFSSGKAKHFNSEAHFRQRTSGDSPRCDCGGSLMWRLQCFSLDCMRLHCVVLFFRLDLEEGCSAESSAGQQTGRTCCKQV